MTVLLEAIEVNGETFIRDRFVTQEMIWERLPQHVKDSVYRRVEELLKNYRKRPGHVSKAAKRVALRDTVLNDTQYYSHILYVRDIRWSLWEKLADLERRLDDMDRR